MPIEIRELVIRARVEPPSSAPSAHAAASEEERRDIVAECVEQVLEILRRREER
jgi:Family of unknown function (DUF5908)